MVIRQAVIHRFSVSSGLYKLAGLQNLQLMRNGGLIHFQIIADLSNILLTLKKLVKDLDAGGISEDLEKLRKVAKLIFRNILYKMIYIVTTVIPGHLHLFPLHAILVTNELLFI